MTKLRHRPTGYLTFFVEPTSDFSPINWQQTPKNYRIIEFVGPTNMLGHADSWKFLNNQSALRSGDFRRWAIHISFDSDRADSDRAITELKRWKHSNERDQRNNPASPHRRSQPAAATTTLV